MKLFLQVKTLLKCPQFCLVQLCVSETRTWVEMLFAAFLCCFLRCGWEPRVLSVLAVGVLLTVVSCQHQDEDQSRAAVPQDCLLRDVECIAQKLEASLEEIHRGAREPREEREQRTLGEL